jgi:hypothetical protein
MLYDNDSSVEISTKERTNKKKKTENKFYKGSDDEEDIGEVVAKERTNKHRKHRNTGDNKGSKDVNAKTTDRRPKEFAEDKKAKHIDISDEEVSESVVMG